MNDFERFKAAFEQGAELPTPAKGDNGPRFAAVAAPVEHIAGTLESVPPPGRTKKAARAKGRFMAPASPLALLPDMVARFVASAIERDAIRRRKEAGEPPPWTTNPILATEHFCNVHREHDRVSRWIMAHVIEPNRNDPDLVLKIALARFLNEPEALARLHWPARFNLAQIHEVLQTHAAQGGKLFRTAAYKPPMPPELKGIGTLQCLFDIVLPPIVAAREELAPREGDTLQAFCDRWRGCYSIGPFLAGQITADMKHVAPLLSAADWHSFAVPGPGSMRGLNRLCGRPVAASSSEAQWHATLLHLRSETEAAFAAAGLDPLDAQNVQNWACEFDKYERARDADGKPSRKYQPADATPKPRDAAKAKRSKKKSSEATPDPRTTAAEPETETERQEADTRPSDPGPRCLDAALAYAARGLKVFPALIKAGAKKSHKSAEHSGGERWGATRNSDQIRRDFTKWPDALIGLPTDADNGLWVLEADTLKGRHKHDGLASLQALMAQHGPLPETLTAESPSGSRHLYFRWPEGLTIKNATNAPAPGLDVRGEGGMVIAPPSLRETGAYRWVCEAEIAEAPCWLLQLVAGPADDKPQPQSSDDIDPEALGTLWEIRAALSTILREERNRSLDWQGWNNFGMATFRAAGGSEDGFALFDSFSQHSGEYDDVDTRKRWQGYHSCPPHTLGFAYLASEAHKIDPEWRLTVARAEAKMKAKAAGDNASDDAGAGPQAATDELISVRASAVAAEALDWLWPGRFARGKLGIIAGLPDEGKGVLTAHMAARCTNPELLWPCGEGKAPQGNVILLTAEDDIADTVVPRLMAAGADRDHIEIIKLVVDTDKFGKPRRRMFSLVRDLEKLRAKIAEIGNVVLIIIDPITAYLGVGEIDSFRDADVRAVLAPLQELAGELDITVVALMHFNKKVDVVNVMLRVSNSLAFVAASRHVYAVVHDPDTRRTLLVRGKNNLARRDDRALAFRIDVREVGRDQRNGRPIEAPFLIWESEYVDITATEALQAINESKAPGARGQAKKWLRELLRNGPVLQTEIEEACKAEGIAIKTLRRAQKELGVIPRHDGPPNSEGNKTWRWHLPV
jgi:hypothetical protein